MSDFLCHDFKSPRADASRRLPNTFRVIPLAFYLSLVAGAYFITMDIIAYRRANQRQADAENSKKEREGEKQQHMTELAALETEAAKAAGIAKWIEGTRVVQPIFVKTAQTMPVEVGITDLTLQRNPEIPSQLDFVVRMNGATPQLVGDIDNALGRLNYRSYNPQRNPAGEKGIEYRTTLVFQNR